MVASHIFKIRTCSAIIGQTLVKETTKTSEIQITNQTYKK